MARRLSLGPLAPAVAILAVVAGAGCQAERTGDPAATPTSDVAAMARPVAVEPPRTFRGLDGATLRRVDAVTLSDEAITAGSGDASSWPIRQVAPFYLDEHEVTVRMWRRCVDAGHCTPLPEPTPTARTQCMAFNRLDDAMPMNCVTRNDAQAYCAAWGRRLPNEWEWLAAAAGSGGVGRPTDIPATPGADPAVAPDDWMAKATRVGGDDARGFPLRVPGAVSWDVGPFGHRDLVANVAEWGRGVHLDTGASPEGPAVRSDGTPRAPVLGGSWVQPAGEVSSLRRRGEWPDARPPEIGFRCAVDVSAHREATCPEGTSCEAPKAEVPDVPWGTDRVRVEGAEVSRPRVTPLGLVRDEGSAPRRVAGFFIDRTEVRADAYASCVKRGECARPAAGRAGFHCTVGTLGLESHPANCVSWEQAQRFCAAQGGRLPTEDEWYVAAFGPGRGRAVDLAPDAGNRMRANEEVWEDADGWPLTAPVDAYPAVRSPSGLLGVEGNVAEWTVAVWTEPPVEGAAERPPWSIVGRSWRDYRESDARAPTDFRRPDTVGFRCAWDE